MEVKQRTGISRREGGVENTAHNNVTSTNRGGNFFPINLIWLNLP